MYNYREMMMTDIRFYIHENFEPEEIAEKMQDRDNWEMDLYDNLFTDDTVTGNASGSYFFSTWKAEEALLHNWDLLGEALDEFCCNDINPIDKGAEWCDVTIRCYLLGECLSAALDELEESEG